MTGEKCERPTYIFHAKCLNYTQVSHGRTASTKDRELTLSSTIFDAEGFFPPASFFGGILERAVEIESGNAI